MPTLNSKIITYEQLAKTIDHSLLKPELTEADITSGCQLAARYHVASVCVKPCFVPLAVQLLKGSDVAVGTVLGFPHGGSITAVKVFEAEDAMDNGAVELDMVINIGELRSGNREYVLGDIRAVVKAAHKRGAIVKVILENAYLTDAEKVLGCQLAELAEADFVQTSTGFARTHSGRSAGGHRRRLHPLRRHRYGGYPGRIQAATKIKEFTTRSSAHPNLCFLFLFWLFLQIFFFVFLFSSLCAFVVNLFLFLGVRL